MPIYEYVCHNCGTKFELMRPISKSSEPAPCPQCQKIARRAVSRCASFSRSESGVSTPIGGSSCSSCGGSSCSTCGH